MKLRFKYNIFILLFIGILSSCDETPQESKLPNTYTFLVGSYTSQPTEGIGLLSFDYESGIMDFTTLNSDISNPSFVISNSAQDIIFAVEENEKGTVKSFAFDRATNTTTLLDEVSSYGAHPCYLALSPDESILVVGNYSSGNFSAYSVNQGKLTHIQTVTHEGSSVNLSRQSQSHVHSTVFHPDGNHLLVGDLGADKIYIYEFKPTYAVSFRPMGLGYIEVDAGAGPRHLTIHPSGKYVYLVHELSAEIGVYSFLKGKMEKLEAHTLTAPDFFGSVGAAEVRLSPDAGFLYVSNRGDANEITSFKIEGDGKLTLIERTDTGGQTPRNFTLTKDGKYLLVANQDSEDIQVFERNLQSGKLTKKSVEIKTNKPVYLFSLDG